MSKTAKQRHLEERQDITDKAIAAWSEANRRFAQLSINGAPPAIMEEYRFQALAAYEALLDSITCERTALMLLDAANVGQPHPRQTLKLPKPKPKDPA